MKDETSEDQNEKLRDAQDLFEDAVDHHANAHLEAHRAERFYHNTECEGQWESEDLEYLRDQLRPAFTFNIIKSKVDTFLGMYADAQRRPVVSAASGDDEDQLLADVINTCVDQQFEEARYEELAARMLKTSAIAGDCGMHIEFAPSDDGEDWIKINLHRILPFELHWDISSVEPDRSDARYVFWDRWFSRSEFKNAYPKHAKDWDTITTQGDSEDGLADSGASVELGGNMFGAEDDYDQERFYRYYYNRRKNKIRVIRYEYKAFVEKYYVVNLETGEKQEVDAGTKERVEQAQFMGMPVEWSERTEEVTLVCEFAGTTMLGEYEQAGPFEGFSIVSSCYDIDEEVGTAYGLIRNLFDPQQELNKSKSLEIEYLAQSTAPGVIAEEDAITDTESFSDEMKRAGGVALVKKGALQEGRVQDRNITPPSAMVAQRMQGAMELLSEVSTIPSASNLTAAEHAQAGVSVALRYHKSRQAVSSPFSHHESA